MSWHVIVEKPVSRALGNLGLSHDVLLRLFNDFLHDDLVNNATEHRHDRAPEDPDCCFRYRASFAAEGSWHDFYFTVVDSTAPGYLFVETVVYERHPGP